MRNQQDFKGELVLYKKDIKVKLEKDTIWANQKQMADIFDKDPNTIGEHLGTIFREKELSKRATTRKFRVVQKEGTRLINRPTDYYNLDAIISVGYRVNSKKGTQFRIWATKKLKEHLTKGFTINKSVFKTNSVKYQELKKTINLLDIISASKHISDESKGILKVLSEYSKALDILDDYDHKKLSVPKGKKTQRFKLTYEKAIEIVEEIKQKNKKTNLVGKQKDKSFKSSVSAIYQTFNKKDLYSTVEEKAAYLLYFLVKNHSFIDGNKRIAAAIFIYFVKRNNILGVDNNTLATLTLMIALSNPKDKESIIRIILNIISVSKS